MTKELELNPDYRDLLTDLCLSVGLAGPADWKHALQDLPDGPALLRVELERVLADRVYLGLHLRHLDRVLPRPLPLRERFASDRLRDILAEGLDALTPEELLLLALDHHQLCLLRDLIADEYPAYWLSAVQQARLRHAEETGRPLRRASDLVPTLFAEPTAAALEASPPAEGQPLRWTETVPLQKAEWLDRGDPHEAALAEARAVAVEFSWPSSVLTAELVSGPLFLARGRCEASLRDAAGSWRVPAQAQDEELRFELPLGFEGGESLVLTCEYEKEDAYRLRFEIALSLGKTPGE